MKTTLLRFRVYLLAAFIGCNVLFQRCHDQCEDRYTFTYYEPVYTPLSVLRSSIAVDEPHPITGVGKIYFKDGYLYVNEPGKGIHVIDNHDPSNPVRKHFITIPGNTDMAIRDNILYADSYVDLVGLDISNPDQVVAVSRLENIFSQYNNMGFYVDQQRGVVTDWTEQKNVEISESPCQASMQPWGGFYYRGGIAMEGDWYTATRATGSAKSTGVGGSMARFTISDDHLYMLDGGSLHTVDISNPVAVAKQSTSQLSWDIETIFPYNDKLFIGSRSGMLIFSLDDPSKPTKVSTYEHVRSCDPVVVDGENAYVTLRSGTECQGFTNQLEVIDVADWTKPALVKTYPMKNPHGLGVDESLLFICDGDAGLKIYDATDRVNIDQHLIKHYDKIHAYDVIPYNNVLMLIGEDGIFQYDYSDPTKIKLLSQLSIKSEQ